MRDRGQQLKAVFFCGWAWWGSLCWGRHGGVGGVFREEPEGGD